MMITFYICSHRSFVREILYALTSTLALPNGLPTCLYKLPGRKLLNSYVYSTKYRKPICASRFYPCYLELYILKNSLTLNSHPQ